MSNDLYHMHHMAQLLSPRIYLKAKFCKISMVSWWNDHLSVILIPLIKHLIDCYRSECSIAKDLESLFIIRPIPIIHGFSEKHEIQKSINAGPLRDRASRTAMYQKHLSNQIVCRLIGGNYGLQSVLQTLYLTFPLISQSL